MMLETIRLFARTARQLTTRARERRHLRMDSPGRLAGSMPIFRFNPG